MPLGKTIWFSDTDVMIPNTTQRNALPTISSNQTSEKGIQFGIHIIRIYIYIHSVRISTGRGTITIPSTQYQQNGISSELL